MKKKLYRIISAYNKDGYWKMIHYKGNKFMMGYSSEGKTWNTLKGAENAIVKLAKDYDFSQLSYNFLGIEDENQNVVKWFDTNKRQFS